MAVPAGVRLRPASMLVGRRLCGKETSSPKPESEERWTSFGKVTLVPGDRETQGVPPPSSVLSANVCLSMCFSTPFHICITAVIVSCIVVLWCVVVYFLLYSLGASFLFLRVSVNRQTVVRATDESRPGLLPSGF